MKKLMIAAAIVCAAAMSQAASAVSWMSGTMFAPGADGTGYGDVLMGGEEGYSALLKVFAWDATTSTVGAEITGLGDGAVSTTVIEGGQMLGVTEAVLADDTIYAMQLILTKGDSILESQVVLGATSGQSGLAEPYFGDGGIYIDPLPGKELDRTYGAFSAAGWQTVPEPTSGLLLLIGVAGLALRRRRA